MMGRMGRRRFTREFKVETVKLIRERGVAVKQAPARAARKACSRIERQRSRGHSRPDSSGPTVDRPR
jgi:transposase-like protein